MKTKVHDGQFLPIREEFPESLKRQARKTHQRIAMLAYFGLDASQVDLNGIRLGARDVDRVIQALRKAHGLTGKDIP